MKLALSSVMSWKKEANYILNRKRVLRVCKSHFYSAKHFIAPAFKKVPYLVFDPDIFIFLRDKASGRKTILLYLFSLSITQNDFPVTQKWAALHSESFCLLQTELLPKKKNHKNLSGQIFDNEKDYWIKSFNYHLHSRVIYV